MSRKYELTNETLKWHGRTLHRIRALRDFGDVKAGDLGGWVESEDNLSHRGNCWLYGEAKAYDEAHLFDNSCAYDSAELSGRARTHDNARLSGRAHAYGNACLAGDMYATRAVVCIGDWRGYATISDNHINIWYHVYTIDEWSQFSDRELAANARGVMEWWKEWGNTILTIAKEHREGVGGKSDS